MSEREDADAPVDMVAVVRERLTGEQMVHRLRDWSDGDTLYGVTSINLDTGASSGKTYRAGGEYGADAEQKARDHFAGGTLASGVTVLYRATVQNPRTEPANPMDPGEPPLKFAYLEGVEILDWKQNRAGGDAR